MSPLDPPPTALDSSVVVAGLLPWHAKHTQARATLVLLLGSSDRRGQTVVPLPALVESYSVLTRLPAPHRLSADDAHDLLAGLLRRTAVVKNLEAGEGWEFLASQRDAGVYGGTVYDALILTIAMRAGARRLLTLNARHFERLAMGGIEIVVPALPAEP